MKGDMINKKGVDRRDFIKGTAVGVGVATAAGSGLLSTAPAQEVAAVDKFTAFAPKIDPAQIKEKIDADVVVVGIGISGTCAGLSAAMDGAKVVMIEKGAKYNARGFDDGAFNSTAHKEAGIIYDRKELIQELMVQANYRADQRLVTAWVDNSGEAIDWLRSLVESKGVKASVGGAPRAGQKYVEQKEGPYKVWHTAVNWTGQNAGLMTELHKILPEKGVEIRYNTPGVKLIRPGNKGRVTGVIGKKADGTYVQFNAKKGVILSCGGYDNNPELMKKWLRPSDLRIERFNSQNIICTGDGHLMGLDIGADIDEPPHCMIVGYGSVAKEEFYMVMFTPYLRVDKNGRRFVNEDSDYCRSANANAIQPGNFNWCVVDSVPMAGAGGGWLKAQLDNVTKENGFVTAPTIEELAVKMKADPAVLKATVDRYNELAAKKQDDDFCVEGDKMKPLLKPPFYAFAVRNFALVTVSGLKINEKTQVLDKDGKVIPGLYASGNTSGGFFSDTYQRNVHGVSHGRAITFGRLAGRHAAAQKA